MFTVLHISAIFIISPSASLIQPSPLGYLEMKLFNIIMPGAEMTDEHSDATVAICYSGMSYAIY